MENITNYMLRFKEAVRHVWNAYLVESYSPMSPKLQESFEKIERELFRALVLLPWGIPDVADIYRRVPMPIMLQAKTGLTEIPVQFGSLDVNRNIKWGLPCTVLVDDLQLYQFIEFFDWNPYGCIDLNYVKVMSGDGRFALVEQLYCDFTINLKLGSEPE